MILRNEIFKHTNGLLVWLCIFLFTCTNISAQTWTWEDFLNRYLSNQEDEDKESINDDLEQLEEMHNNPINLNDCSREDLLRIPLVGTAEADSLLSYIGKNGAILSAGELELVKGLHYEVRQALPLFVSFGETPPKDFPHNIWKQWLHSHQELETNVNFPFYKRKGFKESTAKGTGQMKDAPYLGNPLSGVFRYRSDYRQQLQTGFTIKQDDGEPFAQDCNTLFDSYSFYILRRNQTGKIHSWVLGDYRLHFGKGLTAGIGGMNSGLALLSSRHSHSEGLFPHTGTDEFRYMRGGAISLSFRPITLTLFTSFRQLDGRLEGDSLFSILTTGYHRLTLERQRKGNVNQTTTGTSVDIKIKAFTAGVSAVYAHYDHSFVRGDKPYQQYNMEGQDFLNVGLHYQYDRKKVNLGGETAFSSEGTLALLHEARIQLPQNFRLFLQHRYYGKQYQAPWAWTYAGGGKYHGEHGMMFGMAWLPYNKWSFSGYADGYRLLTPTFTALSPSNGYTLQSQLTYQAFKTLRFLVNYRLRSRQQNSKNHPDLLYGMKHTLRFETDWKLNKSVTFITMLDGTLYKPSVGNIQRGGLISERIIANLWDFKLSSAFTAFHTDSYDAALYAYQPSLLYCRSYSGFFYHGYAATVTLQKDFARHFDFALKTSALHYSNRDSIGSADRCIESPNKLDLTLQFRYLF